MSAKRKIVVFTDLDATLLDPHTYSWEPALEALDKLKRLGAGLVLVSSKTLVEMKSIAEGLGFHDPMIVENGGGIVWKRSSPIDLRAWGPENLVEHCDDEDSLLLPLGTKHDVLLKFLEEISTDTGVPVRSFSRMTIAEVCSLTGLDEFEARKAQQRLFDEPFLVLGSSSGEDIRKLQSAAKARGLEVVQGGRFWHLMGHQGKGAAVSLLMKAYKKFFEEIFTVGLGDSPNDLEFLRLVDQAMILGGAREISASEAPLGAMRVAEVGPVGWNRAMGTLLSSLLEASI